MTSPRTSRRRSLMLSRCGLRSAYRVISWTSESISAVTPRPIWSSSTPIRTTSDACTPMSDFFRDAEGAFQGLPVNGRNAYSWIVNHSGVAAFDRRFRVQPYGAGDDDWLRLQADAARNRREPRSSISLKHFPMSPGSKGGTGPQLDDPTAPIGSANRSCPVAGKRNADLRVGTERAWRGGLRSRNS